MHLTGTVYPVTIHFSLYSFFSIKYISFFDHIRKSHLSRDLTELVSFYLQPMIYLLIFVPVVLFIRNGNSLFSNCFFDCGFWTVSNYNPRWNLSSWFWPGQISFSAWIFQISSGIRSGGEISAWYIISRCRSLGAIKWLSVSFELWRRSRLQSRFLTDAGK